jgi:hypothetical protein
MMPPRRIAALAAALSLALPAGALAQGAGDNQYQDPFAGEDQGSGGGGGAEGTTGNGSELSDTPPSSERQASQPSGELARTGADPGLLALLGAGLILTGAGMRVRVRRPLA